MPVLFYNGKPCYWVPSKCNGFSIFSFRYFVYRALVLLILHIFCQDQVTYAASRLQTLEDEKGHDGLMSELNKFYLRIACQWCRYAFMYNLKMYKRNVTPTGQFMQWLNLYIFCRTFTYLACPTKDCLQSSHIAIYIWRKRRYSILQKTLNVSERYQVTSQVKILKHIFIWKQLFILLKYYPYKSGKYIFILLKASNLGHCVVVIENL